MISRCEREFKAFICRLLESPQHSNLLFWRVFSRQRCPQLLPAWSGLQKFSRYLHCLLFLLLEYILHKKTTIFPKIPNVCVFKFRLSVKTSSSLFWNSSPRDMVKAMNQDGGIFWPSLSVWLWCVLVSWFQNRRIRVLWTDKKRDNSYRIFFCLYIYIYIVVVSHSAMILRFYHWEWGNFFR